MYRHHRLLHLMYMARKQTERRVQPRFKAPIPRRTFIREWREFRGRTLEEAAEAIGPHIKGGITHASLSRIERGKQPYKQPILEALAVYLETSVAALLSRRPGDGEFWTTYERLSEDQQQDVARYTAFVQEKAAKTGT